MNAVALFTQTVQAAPDKIEVLALGPLTNLAEAFTKTPALVDKIDRITIMGGAVDVPGSAVSDTNKTAEWNIYCDPPAARVALLTLKGRNEEKVQFSAEHLRKELHKLVGRGGEKEQIGKEVEESAMLFGMESTAPVSVKAPHAALVHFRDLIIAGPAPAPLLRAETFYRYQIMLRTRAMSRLSHALAKIVSELVLPEDVTLTVDIDPASLS